MQRQATAPEPRTHLVARRRAVDLTNILPVQDRCTGSRIVAGIEPLHQRRIAKRRLPDVVGEINVRVVLVLVQRHLNAALEGAFVLLDVAQLPLQRGDGRGAVAHTDAIRRTESDGRDGRALDRIGNGDPGVALMNRESDETGRAEAKQADKQAIRHAMRSGVPDCAAMGSGFSHPRMVARMDDLEKADIGRPSPD